MVGILSGFGGTQTSPAAVCQNKHPVARGAVTGVPVNGRAVRGVFKGCDLRRFDVFQTPAAVVVARPLGRVRVDAAHGVGNRPARGSVRVKISILRRVGDFSPAAVARFAVDAVLLSALEGVPPDFYSVARIFQRRNNRRREEQVFIACPVVIAGKSAIFIERPDRVAVGFAALQSPVRKAERIGAAESSPCFAVPQIESVFCRALKRRPAHDGAVRRIFKARHAWAVEIRLRGFFRRGSRYLRCAV